MPLQKSTMRKSLFLAFVLLASHGCLAAIAGQKFQRMRFGLGFADAVGTYANKISCASLCLWSKNCNGFCYNELRKMCYLSGMEYFSQTHYRVNMKGAVIYWKTHSINRYEVFGDKIILRGVSVSSRIACHTTCKYLASDLPLPKNAEENGMFATLGKNFWLRVMFKEGSFLDAETDEPIPYENWRDGRPVIGEDDPLVITFDTDGYWTTTNISQKIPCMCEKMVSKCSRDVVDQTCFVQ